jgi:hypothetical protein
MKQLSRLMVVAASSTLGWTLCHGQSALDGTATGGNVGGQRRGGISYVTRRVPMAVPNQIAGGYFAAAGVPVGGGAVRGGFNGPGTAAVGAVRFAENQSSGALPVTEGEAEALTPAAFQALQVLARNGDKDARAALAQFRAPNFGTAVQVSTDTVAPESE